MLVTFCRALNARKPRRTILTVSSLAQALVGKDVAGESEIGKVGHRTPCNFLIKSITPQFDALIYAASIWVIPLIIAITFHEAAHGYVARFFGDNTAWQFGRVTLNPFKHIDPVGTVLLPALLFITRSPFLFGYAKPVPVNFGALRNPRRDMIFVAAAGPAMNFILAVIAALLFHLVSYLPDTAEQWVAENLKNGLVINVILAIF